MSGSFYALNTKYNQLLALINAGGGGGSLDLEQVLINGNDANGEDITGVDNLDVSTINGSAYPPVVPADDLQEVLTAGNDSNLSILLKNNLVTPTASATLQSTSLSFSSTSGDIIAGSYTGNAIALQDDATGSSVGTAGINATAINSSGTLTASLGGGVVGIPNPPYPAPDANWSLSVDSGTYNPTLYMSKSAVFTNSTSLTLGLTSLAFNQGTGSPSPDDDFTISSNKDLLLVGNNISATAVNTTLTTSTAGGAVNPLLTLTNTNATGSVAMEVYKNKPTAGIAGDVLFNQSVYGKDNGNVKQEYTRISHTIRDSAIAGEDGSIEFSAFVNGAVATFLQINGNENEINVLKPLDLAGGGVIRNTTGNIDITTTASTGTGTITIAPNTGASVLITSEAEPATDFIRINPQVSANSQQLLMTATDVPSGFINSISLNNSQYAPSIELKADFGSPERSITISANGNTALNSIVGFDTQGNAPLLIDTSGYTNGSIELKVQDTTGSLILTGTSLLDTNAGGNSGQHLRVKINGTYYKIQLLDD